MELDDSKRYAAAALFTLALHSTQVGHIAAFMITHWPCRQKVVAFVIPEPVYATRLSPPWILLAFRPQTSDCVAYAD